MRSREALGGWKTATLIGLFVWASLCSVYAQCLPSPVPENEALNNTLTAAADWPHDENFSGSGTLGGLDWRDAWKINATRGVHFVDIKAPCCPGGCQLIVDIYTACPWGCDCKPSLTEANGKKYLWIKQEKSTYCSSSDGSGSTPLHVSLDNTHWADPNYYVDIKLNGSGNYCFLAWKSPFFTQ